MVSDNFPVLSNEYAEFLRRIIQTMDADVERRKGYIVSTRPECYTLPLVKPRGNKHKYAIRTHIGEHESFDEIADTPVDVYDKFSNVSILTTVSNMVDAKRYFEYIFVGYFYPSNECMVTKINNNVLVKPKPFYEDIPYIKLYPPGTRYHRILPFILNEDELFFPI